MNYTSSLTIFALFFATILTLAPINANVRTKNVRGHKQTNVHDHGHVGTTEKYQEFKRYVYGAQIPQTVEIKPSKVVEEREKAITNREQLEDSIVSPEMIETDKSKVLEERLKGVQERLKIVEGREVTSADDAAKAADNAGKASAAAQGVETAIGTLPTPEEIMNNSELMACVMKLLLGCIIGFSGYQLFCDMLGVATGLVGGVFIYQIISDMDYEWVAWGQYVGGVLGGVLCAIMVKKVYMFAVFLIGAAFGVMGSHYLKDPLGFYEKYFPDDAQAAYYGAIPVLGILAGYVAMYAEKHVFIAATAFIGSTFFTGGVQGLAPDLTEQAYTIITISLTVIGVCLQYQRMGFK